MTNQKTQIAPGDRVDDYLVIEELGEGAAASVYRVQHAASGELRALKMLKRAALADEEIQRRFVREVSVMQKLTHENLVQIFESGLHEDSFYYVMELVDSGTLKEVLGGSLSWRDVAEVGVQMAVALSVLHECEMVHRDIKPGNVYLSSNGQVKIGDFGLVRDHGSSRLTVEGMTVGTVLYMAPEQIMGEDDIDGRTDLYGLGCLLYQLLTGQPPFHGEQAVEVLKMHLNDSPPNAHVSRPDCPESFAKLIQVLLSKSREDRPRDALAVATALKQVLAGHPLKFDHLSARDGTISRTPKSGKDSTTDPEAAEAPASDISGPNLTERLQQSKATGEISTHKLLAVAAAVLVAIALAVVFGR